MCGARRLRSGRGHAPHLVPAGRPPAPSSTRLGIDAVPVNAEMDTGVPWCSAVDDDPVTLLTESGNFGKQDLLVRAATVTELG